MARILALTGADIQKVLTFDQTIAKVEEGYAALYRGDVEMPPIQHLENHEAHGELDIKSAFIRRPGPYADVKIASGFFRNRDRGLPTSFATIMLLDGETGAPLAMMEGGLITDWRTGAAAAVSAKYLARGDSETVGLIGSGIIAGMALRALCRVRPIRRAFVWSPDATRRADFAERLAQELGLAVNDVDSPAGAVAAADIVVTATPAREPVVTKSMVRPGAHIVAIGSDGPGKQELDAQLVASAKLVVDRISQCNVAGELQHPLRLGLMQEAHVYAEIGAIVAGSKPGRTSRDEITVFDSTGTAAQDIVVAALVYEQAMARGLGTQIEL